MSTGERILLCPGQGAQKTGMGTEWFNSHPASAQTFAAADEALELNGSDLVREVSEDPMDTASGRPAQPISKPCSSLPCTIAHPWTAATHFSRPLLVLLTPRIQKPWNQKPRNYGNPANSKTPRTGPVRGVFAFEGFS